MEQDTRPTSEYCRTVRNVSFLASQIEIADVQASETACQLRAPSPLNSVVAVSPQNRCYSLRVQGQFSDQLAVVPGGCRLAYSHQSRRGYRIEPIFEARMDNLHTDFDEVDRAYVFSIGTYDQCIVLSYSCQI